MSDVDQTFDELPLNITTLLTKHFLDGRNFIVGYRLVQRFMQSSLRLANNESSEDIEILLPVTLYFNPSTRPDNVKNL